MRVDGAALCSSITQPGMSSRVETEMEGSVNMEAEGTSSLTTETQPVLEELMAFNQHNVQMIYPAFAPFYTINVKF